MIEILTINNDFRPESIPNRNISPGEETYDDYNYAIKKLELDLERGRPCFSLSTLKTAYWTTAPNNKKEIGLLVQSNLATNRYIENYFIGICKTEDIDNLRYFATEKANYSSPGIVIAVLGLKAFLYPEVEDQMLGEDPHLHSVLHH